jgi:hypothetical protein
VALEELQVLPSAHQIEPDAGYGQFHQRLVCVAHVTEVGLHQQARRSGRLGQPAVGPIERADLVGGPVLDETRLVELDPIRPQLTQPSDDLRQHLG